MNLKLLDQLLNLYKLIQKAHLKLLKNDLFKNVNEKHTKMGDLISFYLGNTFYVIDAKEQVIYSDILNQVPLTDEILNNLITNFKAITLRVSFPDKYDTFGNRISMEVLTHLTTTLEKMKVCYDQRLSSCNVTMIKENISYKAVIDTVNVTWFENIDSFRHHIDIEKINKWSEDLDKVGVSKPKVKRWLNQ